MIKEINTLVREFDKGDTIIFFKDKSWRKSFIYNWQMVSSGNIKGDCIKKEMIYLVTEDEERDFDLTNYHLSYEKKLFLTRMILVEKHINIFEPDGKV